MKISFWIIALAGFLYFLLKKRKVDFFSVAFFSGLLYFMPGFVGYVLEYGSLSEPYLKMPVVIVDEAYLVMMFVLFSIIIGAIIYDCFFKNTPQQKKMRSNPSFAVLILFIFALFGMVYTAFELGQTFFSSSKLSIYENKGRFYNLWVYSAAIGVSLAYAQRRWVLFSLFFVFLLLDSVFIMNRTFLVIGSLSVSVLFLNSKGPIRLINHWKIGIVLIFFGFTMFGFHHIKDEIKNVQFDVIFNRLSTFDFYLYSVLNSEPWGTQAVLNKVIDADFKVSGQYFFSSFYVALPYASALGAEVITFNDLFQYELFPWVVGGLASNPWAEMWSIGGWLALVTFVFFYVFVVGIGSKAFQFNDPVIKSAISLIFIVWAFYIHRNGLSTILMIERRILILLIFSISISIFLTQIPRKI